MTTRATSILNHFGSSHFLLRTCAVFYPFMSFSGLVLSKCQQPNFVVSHRFSWHVSAMERTCWVSLSPVSSSNMGSLDGSLLDYEGSGYRSSAMEEEINEMFKQFAMLPLLMQSTSSFEDYVQTLSQTVASYDATVTNVEQIIGSLAARVVKLEIHATTASSGCGSARSLEFTWPVMAPSGPTLQHLQMTTGTQDVDLKLFPAQRMSMHEVPFCFDFHVNNITRKCLPGSTIAGRRPTHLSASLPEYTAKQAPCLPDSYPCGLNERMMVSPTKLTVHFAESKPISRSASPGHLKTGKSENDLCLGEKFWQQSSKFSSLKEMKQVPSLSLHLTSTHKFSASRIAETA